MHPQRLYASTGTTQADPVGGRGRLRDGRGTGWSGGDLGRGRITAGQEQAALGFPGTASSQPKVLEQRNAKAGAACGMAATGKKGVIPAGGAGSGAAGQQREGEAG